MSEKFFMIIFSFYFSRTTKIDISMLVTLEMNRTCISRRRFLVCCIGENKKKWKREIDPRCMENKKKKIFKGFRLSCLFVVVEENKQPCKNLTSYRNIIVETFLVCLFVVSGFPSLIRGGGGRRVYKSYKFSLFFFIYNKN